MTKSVEKAYLAIREAIVGQQFQPGERLKEEPLALHLGVSRTPVREALRRLSAEGLLELSPNQGATVTNWSIDDVDEIFGLRLALETHGVGLAATKASPAQIAELERLCGEIEELAKEAKAGYLPRLATRNRAFHRVLVEAGGGNLLARLLSQVIEMSLMMNTYTFYSPEEMARSLGHHRELVQALRARDPVWARAVMAAHIQSARNTYMTSQERQPEPGARPQGDGWRRGAAPGERTRLTRSSKSRRGPRAAVVTDPAMLQRRS